MIWAKTLLWLFCLTPAARLAYKGFTGDLTANPIEFITLETGFWTLTFLVLSLAVTPLRRITGYNRLIQFRRPIGLFAFFYATLHFSTYIGLDRFFDFSSIGEDILKRPYITVGFTAFLLLIPLALTSTKASIRRLGKRWTTLHRLVYVSAALGVLHFYWKKSAKHDLREPLIFATILGALLLFRVVNALLKKRQKKVPAAARSATV
jgi:methionine sulfoxide reductase heme-binding subunit